jgi:hypothetical protein
LRSCGGTKKRSVRPDHAEFDVGWSWLERWMVTWQAEPVDDCMSQNTVTCSVRRVFIVKCRHDLTVEEKESCASNDVSAVSFDGSNGSGGRLNCHKPTTDSRVAAGTCYAARWRPRTTALKAQDHTR